MSELSKAMAWILISKVYINNFQANSIEGYGFADLRDLTKTLLELAFYNIVLHYSMFKEFKTSNRKFVEGQVVSNKDRISKLIIYFRVFIINIASLLEKCATLLNNKAVFPTTWTEGIFL